MLRKLTQGLKSLHYKAIDFLCDHLIIIDVG